MPSFLQRIGERVVSVMLGLVRLALIGAILTGLIVVLDAIFVRPPEQGGE
jgi:hypothetical protein